MLYFLKINPWPCTCVHQRGRTLHNTFYKIIEQYNQLHLKLSGTWTSSPLTVNLQSRRLAIIIFSCSRTWWSQRMTNNRMRDWRWGWIIPWVRKHKVRRVRGWTSKIRAMQLWMRPFSCWICRSNITSTALKGCITLSFQTLIILPTITMFTLSFALWYVQLCTSSHLHFLTVSSVNWRLLSCRYRVYVLLCAAIKTNTCSEQMLWIGDVFIGFFSATQIL